MNNMESKELLELIPRPWKAFFISSVAAGFIIAFAMIIESSITNGIIKHIVIVILFNAIFIKMVSGERKQFIALNSLRKDYIEKDVQAISNLLLIKTIVTSVIVSLPFILGNGISDTLKNILLPLSFFITWHNVYKGIAGDFRFNYIRMILNQIIEEKRQQKTNN